MQRNDRWPEDYDPDGPPRSSSRRGSASLSRRSSTKNRKEEKKEEARKDKKSPQSSVNSTPKRTKPLDFVVTGKQCLKKSDRANSLPGYHRRPSVEKTKKLFESPKKTAVASQSSKSRETSLEDDMSLDLSQVSDFEDTNSKYGIKSKLPLAASTPKPRAKPRAASLQPLGRRPESRDTCSRDASSRDASVRDASSRDSLYTCRTASTGIAYKAGASTELDYSSVSPECSGQSSAELSPRPEPSPRSQEPNVSSCGSWQECSERRGDGEWSRFWADYNGASYDQCPTPYRQDAALPDLDTPGSLKRVLLDQDDVTGACLTLSARETRRVLHCARALGAVLAAAARRQRAEEDPELELKKKTLTLDLTEPNEPAEAVVQDITHETVTTQTDISLPNTKSAPRIFEKILRQLSRTSLDDGLKALEAKAMENKANSEGTSSVSDEKKVDCKDEKSEEKKN